ncbi:MAG: hypothetical protein ABI780_01505 [Ardenticatenales bacterium]
MRTTGDTIHLPFIGTVSCDAAVDRIVARCGETARASAAAGVARVADRWRSDDGDDEAFIAFCAMHYVEEAGDRARLLDRLESIVSQVDGHLYEIRRGLRRWSDLDVPPAPVIDDLAAVFEPAPDLADQWFKQGVAFVALLHFAPPTLPILLADGPTWSVDRWVEARVAGRFGARVPEALLRVLRDTYHAAETFVSSHHIRVDNLIDASGQRWFEPGRALVAHWLIREAIRDGYRAADPQVGVARMRALAWVMRRHTDGTVPRGQIGDGEAGPWDAAANTIAGEPVTAEEQYGPERYEHWLAQFRAARALDAFEPDAPNAITRACARDREIDEHEVEDLLVQLLDAPERSEINGWLRRRLGRPLEAFDIYFDAALPSADADVLDAAVAARFPTAAAFEAALPSVLESLGFAPADASFLGERVRVEVARGAGHAVSPGRPEYAAWLRTNGRNGQIGWAGFDIAMHELGHNIEQLTSLHRVPRPALRGVPNTACSEAFAFLFQAEARRVLGVAPDVDPAVVDAATTLESALSAIQIAGPALLELRAWRWLYAHPDADANALRDTVLGLADDLWARHFAADFGPDPYALLAAYQHMISYPLYLPNYAIGHMISHQIRRHLAGRDLAAETLRICAIGSVTPALWMERAVGEGLSARRLVEGAALAVRRLDTGDRPEAAAPGSA